MIRFQIMHDDNIVGECKREDELIEAVKESAYEYNAKVEEMWILEVWGQIHTKDSIDRHKFNKQGNRL